ncbi:hypothetical protein L9F63_005357, partial [Diploptera punctata]
VRSLEGPGSLLLGDLAFLPDVTPSTAEGIFSVVDSTMIRRLDYSTVRLLIVDSTMMFPGPRLNYSTTRLLNYSTTHLLNYSTTRLLNYSTTQLLNYSTTQLRRLDYSTTQIRRLDYSTTQLLNYSTTQLLNYSTNQLLNFVDWTMMFPVVDSTMVFPGPGLNFVDSTTQLLDFTQL